jgi:hypothetical protein
MKWLDKIFFANCKKCGPIHFPSQLIHSFWRDKSSPIFSSLNFPKMPKESLNRRNFAQSGHHGEFLLCLLCDRVARFTLVHHT